MKVRNDPVTVIVKLRADATGEMIPGKELWAWMLKSGELRIFCQKECWRKTRKVLPGNVP